MRKEQLDHWAQYIENMTQTPQEFYAEIEQLIAYHEVPDVKIKRVKRFEKGLLSAKREYLQISGHNHFFDVCAAPFGRGFFVSYWQREDLTSRLKLISKIPLIGNFAANWKDSVTFYMADTQQMFVYLVHSCIITALDKEIKNKGLKALSDLQRQLPATQK